MHRPPSHAALAAALLVIACAVWALPTTPFSQSSSKSQAPKKTQPPPDQPDQQQQQQQPGQQPAQPGQSSPLFKSTVMIKSSRATDDRTRAASAGFNGVGPDGKVSAAALAAPPTEKDKQQALLLSTRAMPDTEIAKFIQDGKLSPPPAKGGK